jgi:hypothetical protein
VKPLRIQLRRTKGFNLQVASRALNGLECVNVARPSRWGNPYPISMYRLSLSLGLFHNTCAGIWNPSLMEGCSDGLCAAAYAAHHAFLKRMGPHPLELARSYLKDKNLACFCPLTQDCHADIWLAAARGDSI